MLSEAVNQKRLTMTLGDDIIRDHANFNVGLGFLLGNQIDQALSHFRLFENSPRCSFGVAIISYIKSLLTFDASMKKEAIADFNKAAALAELQIKRFESELPSHHHHSLLGGFFGSGSTNNDETAAEVVEYQKLCLLECNLLIADCHLLSAILTLTSENVLQLLKGVVILRKAYKVYERAEVDMKLKNAFDSEANVLDVFVDDEEDIYYDAFQDEGSMAHIGMVRRSASIREIVIGGIQLGRGLFHLVFSMIPPRVRPMFKMLGLTSVDRDEGVQLLQQCFRSGTYRATLVSFILLTYYSILHVFVHYGNQADMKIVQDILFSCLHQYPSSAIYMWYRGRFLRAESKLTKASQLYSEAKQMLDLRQFVGICVWEEAWIFMLRRDYNAAAECFRGLSEEAVAMRGLYLYLYAICFLEETRAAAWNGIPQKSGTLVQILKLFTAIPYHIANNMSNGKPNFVEQYVLNNTLHFLTVASSLPIFQKAQQNKRKSKSFSLFSSAPKETFFNSIQLQSTVVDMKEEDWSVHQFLAKFRTELHVAIESLFSGIHIQPAQHDVLFTALHFPAAEMCYFWNCFYQLDRSELISYNAALEDQAAKLQASQPDQHVELDAMVSLFQSSICKELSQLDAAKQLATKVLDKQRKKQITKRLWLAPFACYDLALIHLCQGDSQGAAKFLKQVDHCVDGEYEFQARLKFKVRVASMAMAERQ